jgi:L-asparaginase/Glu-tRNA(Gln) amidotransferase subunit D
MARDGPSTPRLAMFDHPRRDLSLAVEALVPPSRALSPLPRLLEAAHVLNAALGSPNTIGAIVFTAEAALEEVAFALDLRIAGDKPVVVADLRSAAGRRDDLRAAVVVALAATARAQGVLVVDDGQISAARFVEHTHRAQAPRFTSPRTGPIGAVAQDEDDDDEPRFYVRVPRTPVLAPSQATAVALIKLAMGDHGELLRELRRRHFVAAVVEITDGPLSPLAARRLTASALEMPVVRVDAAVPRRLFDRRHRSTAIDDVLARGVMPGGYLSALKARLVVAFAADADDPHEAVARALAAYV